MTTIRIQRLPSITIANFVAAFHGLYYLVSAVLSPLYFHLMFGRVTTFQHVNVLLVVFQYVLPVFLAWVLTWLVVRAFNALAISQGVSISVGIDDPPVQSVTSESPTVPKEK